MGARLVVTDFDGTLCSRGVVHEDARSALGVLRQREIPVIVATARRRPSLRLATQALGLDLGGVLIDGALGYERLDGDPFYVEAFTRDEVLQIVTLFAERDCEPVFETDDVTNQLIAGASPTMPPAYLEDTPPLVCDLGRALPITVFSAIAIVPRDIGADLVAAASAQGIAAGWTEYPPQFPSTATVKLRPPRCSKWSTIQRLLDSRGLSADDVLAIGNDDNDVELLQHAGVSLAVESASSAALRAADRVVESPEDGGWSRVLDYI